MMPVDWRKRMSIITGTTKRTMTAYSRLRRNAAALAAELPDDRAGVRAHDKFRRGAGAACVYAAETGIKKSPSIRGSTEKEGEMYADVL